ncbi:MAG: alpha/beta fold hydrolase [Reyranellaceae bacterium]
MQGAGAVLVASIVALAAAVIVVIPRYRRDLSAARSAAARGSVIAATASGPIEYAVRGAGVPLLSIHGAGGGFDQGLSNAATFVDDGFRVIAPSRFGYLRTPIPEDSSAGAQAEAHAALLAALDVSEAVVVGVSAGARSAIELAIRHPQRVAALVLIVPGTYAPTSPVNIEGSRGSRLAFWLVNVGADFIWWLAETLVPSVLIRFVGVRPELVAAATKAERERVMGIVRAIEPLSLRFAGINIDSSPDPRRPALERISAPTLVISARDDLFNTLPAAQFAAGAIPGATLRVFDSGGHLLVGRGQETRDTVRAFLADARELFAGRHQIVAQP